MQPPPEESARCLLAVYRNHDIRADQSLWLRVLTGTWFANGWKSENLFAAMEFALENGWIEFKDGQSYVLTAIGFAKMQKRD
jgi:hypothetical protein